MKRWVKTAVVTAMSASLLLASGCFSSSTEAVKHVAKGQKIKVTTVLQAQADFVKEIAKDKADVHALLKYEVNVWQYAPTLKEIRDVEASDVFVLNGGGIEQRWIDQVQRGIKQNAPQEVVVDPSDGLKTRKLIAYLNPDDPVEAKKEHVDPYLYMDLQNAKQEVDAITQALCQVSPDNAAEFQKNASDYKRQIDDLDKKFADTLKNVKHKEIISPYPAYQYLAARYGLKYYVPNTFDWNTVPDDKDELNKLIADLQQHDAKAVYFQTEPAPRVAATLGKAGFKSGVLDPYEGSHADQKQYNNYLATMEHNLDMLQRGLNQ